MNNIPKYTYQRVSKVDRDLLNCCCVLKFQYNPDYPNIDFKRLCAEKELSSRDYLGGTIPIHQRLYIDKILSEYDDDENNILSQEGSCFIGTNARVSTWSRIRDDAKVYQTSIIKGRTLIHHNAVVNNSVINTKNPGNYVYPDSDFMTCIISDNTYINNTRIDSPAFNDDTHILSISGYSYINNVHVHIYPFTNKIINWYNITISVDKSLGGFHPVHFYFNKPDDLNLINFNFDLNASNLKLYREFCIEHDMESNNLFGKKQTENIIHIDLPNGDGPRKYYTVLLTDFINNFN